MATYQKRDDSLVSCPYNPAHRVKKSRYQIHLTKCEQDHLDANKKTCPYNAKHRIDSVEFQHHMTVCPDRGLVERRIAYDPRDNYRGNTSVPSYHNSIPKSEITEFWDDDASSNTSLFERQTKSGANHSYDAKLPEIQDMKRAERRKYYDSLHRREEIEEPVQPIVQKKVLREIREPKTQHKEAERSLERGYLHGGDVQGSNIAGYPSRRLAANIFSHPSGTTMFPPNYLNGQMQNLAIGRGQGVLGTFPPNVSDYPPVPRGRVDDVM